MAHTVVNGHYFLTAKSTPTEVSKLIFNVSFWHSWISAAAIVLSVPLARIAYRN
jgi:hypothetical protein